MRSLDLSFFKLVLLFLINLISLSYGSQLEQFINQSFEAEQPITFSYKIDAERYQFLLAKGLKPNLEIKLISGLNKLNFENSSGLVKEKLDLWIKVNKQVWVAKKDLKAGGIISSVDIEEKYLDIKAIPNTILNKKGDLLEKELKFKKRKGDFFHYADLKEIDVVKNKDEVVIIAKSGLVSVSMPGVALKNGSIGSRIRVLNKETGRIINAEIISPGKVLVEVF